MSYIKQNTAKKVVSDKGSTSWELDISFDVTKEGISFGATRNYSQHLIQKLVNSQATKEAIENGYVTVMYGHDTRKDKRLGGFSGEYNPSDGSPQFALGMVTAVTIKGKILNLKMILIEAPNNFSATIAKYIEFGIGGFSTVFSQKKGMLLGCDFTFMRNFARNKVDVMLDSMCEGAECSIDDVITTEAREIIGSHVELLGATVDILNHDEAIAPYLKLRESISINNKEMIEISDNRDKLLIENEELKRRVKTLEDEVAKVNRLREDLEESLTLLSDSVRNYQVRIRDGESLIRTRDNATTLLLKNQGIEFENGIVRVPPKAFGDIFMDSLMSEKKKKVFNGDNLIKAKKINSQKSNQFSPNSIRI